MNPSALSAWLAERTPRVPDAFLPYLLFGAEAEGASEGMAVGEEAPGVIDASDLARAGAEALSVALARPGQVREAAFPLLTGDAFLTYACEALTEEEGNLEGELGELIQTLGARFP